MKQVAHFFDALFFPSLAMFAALFVCGMVFGCLGNFATAIPLVVASLACLACMAFGARFEQAS